MAEKLYLIRVDMERFIGPVNLKQVRDAYRRMEFGLQDEIAASNKAWVAFDDLERINRIYPELANLIKKEMLSGWGSTEPEPRTLPGSERIDALPKSAAKILGQSVVGVLIVFLVLGALYFVKGRSLSDIKLLIQDPTLSQAMYHYSDSYNPVFESFMERNRSKINKKLKKRKSFRLWIPYVRMVAFANEGEWEGLSLKLLRGKNAQNSPLNCTFKEWRKRWLQSRSQWQLFLEGKILPNEDWARILVWDPVWISQRSKHKLWIQPRNYYEGCLNMAYKAILSLTELKLNTEASIIASRLKWSISQIDSTSSKGNEEFQMSGTMWGLSCVESSEDEEQAKLCFSTLSPVQEWQKLIEERIKFRVSRLMIANNHTLKGQTLEDFQKAILGLPNRGKLTKFDFRDEIAFFKIIMDQNGDIEQAEIKMKDRSPGLKFNY